MKESVGNMNALRPRSPAAGNAEVLNNTADFYRYFDAARHAELLYGCVEQRVRHDLIDEGNFLRPCDAFATRVEALVDMPHAKVELLWRFLRKNQGTLSNRTRADEFSAFTGAEAVQVQQLYQQAWQEARARADGLPQEKAQSVEAQDIRG